MIIFSANDRWDSQVLVTRTTTTVECIVSYIDPHPKEINILDLRGAAPKPKLSMFCALSQNHQPCVCLLVCFLRGISSKYVWCKQWRYQRGTRGTARRSLFPHPHLPHLRRKWHKWASFVKFLDFPPIETHFPRQCPPPNLVSPLDVIEVRDFLRSRFVLFPVPWLRVT